MRKGKRFKSLFQISYVCVAQLDRAFGYGPKGRKFESCHAHYC